MVNRCLYQSKHLLRLKLAMARLAYWHPRIWVNLITIIMDDIRHQIIWTTRGARVNRFNILNLTDID